MLANRSLPEHPSSRPTPERLVPPKGTAIAALLGKAAVDSHSAHSQLGSGLSLPVRVTEHNAVLPSGDGAAVSETCALVTKLLDHTRLCA
jgi:hypothetical protein